jgi:hypothetical protein
MQGILDGEDEGRSLADDESIGALRCVQAAAAAAASAAVAAGTASAATAPHTAFFSLLFPSLGALLALCLSLSLSLPLPLQACVWPAGWLALRRPWRWLARHARRAAVRSLVRGADAALPAGLEIVEAVLPSLEGLIAVPSWRSLVSECATPPPAQLTDCSTDISTDISTSPSEHPAPGTPHRRWSPLLARPPPPPCAHAGVAAAAWPATSRRRRRHYLNGHYLNGHYLNGHYLNGLRAAGWLQVRGAARGGVPRHAAAGHPPRRQLLAAGPGLCLRRERSAAAPERGGGVGRRG